MESKENKIAETEILKKSYQGKVVTITEFRKKFGITVQAVAYAIVNGYIDVWAVGHRVKLVVLTERTKAYKPHNSIKRKKVI